MSKEDYADPIMNDGPRFHSIIPVSKLIECVTRARAIEASDVSSTPLVVETAEGVTTTKTSRHSTGPCYAWGLKKSWTHKETKCALTERWLRS